MIVVRQQAARRDTGREVGGVRRQRDVDHRGATRRALHAAPRASLTIAVLRVRRSGRNTVAIERDWANSQSPSCTPNPSTFCGL